MHLEKATLINCLRSSLQTLVWFYYFLRLQFFDQLFLKYLPKQLVQYCEQLEDKSCLEVLPLQYGKVQQTY